MILKYANCIEVNNKNIDIKAQGDSKIFYLKNDEYFKIVKIILKGNTNIDINIEASQDCIHWKKCDKVFKFNECVDIYFDDDKNKYLKLNNRVLTSSLKFYAQIYPIFMMQSPAGWGDRMIALLNAMYLSKTLKCYFGFTWEEFKINIVDNKNNTYNCMVCKESDIFTKEFINRHSYTRVYQSPYKFFLENNKWYDNIFISKDSVEDYLKKPFQYDWGYCTNHSSLKYYIKNIKADYCKDFPELWNEIGFSDTMYDIFTEVETTWRGLIKKSRYEDFIAIHIRSGEMIYANNTDLYSQTGHNYIWHKILPIEILIEIIEKYSNNNSIILFGEDITTLRLVCQYFKKPNLYIANDYLPNEYSNNWKKEIFDLMLMSKTKEIIGGTSGFARLASLISRGDEPTFWIDLFDEKKRLQIFDKHFGKINIDKMYQSFSLGYMYLGEMHNNGNFSKAKKMIKKALELDEKRGIHNIAYIYCCIMLDEYELAEEHLREILYLRKKDFLYTMSHCILLEYFKKNIFTRSQIFDYPNIAFLYTFFNKENILKQKLISVYKNDTAVFRVTNSLSYKLGKTILASNNIFSVTVLPFK
ncbi:tetratricopeptide repeat protein, partial [Campylobacter coli]|uniref:tetratricopeptide repeat protein n=1 Tax=Campylobacter coli TaxID=195 RepID=UPI00119E4962